METVKAGDIEAAVERKRIRNIYITINSATGEIKVSAPLRAGINVIKSFFESKINWIIKNKEKISRKPLKTKNKYSDGEKVEFLGKTYLLKTYDYSKKPKIFLNFDTIDLYCRQDASYEEKRGFFDVFYEEKLKEVVPGFAQKWQEKLEIKTENNPFKFLIGSVRIRIAGCGAAIEDEKIVLRNPVRIVFKRMKSRWGSCNISDKKITLNTELAKKDLRCIEYVTAHELLHLKERNHNKRFKYYMQNSFPDWKKLEDELRVLD